MMRHRSTDFVRRHFSTLFSAALCFATLSACRHDEPPAPPAAPAAAAATSAVPAAAPPAALAPASEFHDDMFDLAIVPASPYASGKEGLAQIVLTAKGEYHANDKYPYKFKTVDSPGIKYRTPVFSRDDTAVDGKRATMKVDFTPDSSGNKNIAGNFAFSVCSAEHCLVEKRDLTLALSVN